jgi:hypothetical protein
MRKRLPSAKARTSPKPLDKITSEELRQVMSGAMGKSKAKFTQEELQCFGKQFRQAKGKRVKRLTTPQPASGKTGMFPSRPKWARGRKLDVRLLSAFNEWEMALPKRKPSYRFLALRFFGRADCPLCGEKLTISFGDNGYCCERCTAQFLPSQKAVEASERARLDSPKLVFPLPVGGLETVLHLLWADARKCIASLKKPISRLHRKLQERTRSSS